MIGICINSLLNCGLNYLIRLLYRLTLVFFYFISFKILKILDYINFIIFYHDTQNLSLEFDEKFFLLLDR